MTEQPKQQPKPDQSCRDAYEWREGEDFQTRQDRITAYEATQGRTKPDNMDWGTYWKTY